MVLNTFCCVRVERCSCCWRCFARGESAECARSLQDRFANAGFAPVGDVDTYGRAGWIIYPAGTTWNLYPPISVKKIRSLFAANHCRHWDVVSNDWSV